MKELVAVAVIGISAAASSITAPAPARETKPLTDEAFARAEAFMRSSARPIDRYRFLLSFRNGDPARVLAELATYQNPDGGFGRRLEPDLRCLASSAPATVEGLTIADDAGAATDHPLVRAAVGYLVASFDSRKGYWSAAPPDVTSAPHAPWWHPDPLTRKAPAETFVYPTAAILALLHRHSELVPPELLERATGNLLRGLPGTPDKMDAGAVVALLHLTERVPEPRRAALLGKTRLALAATVLRDRRDWSHYGLTPLFAAESPESLLYPGLEREVEDQLDYLLETQEADGGWSPTWSWEKSDAAAWAQARREWRGVVTLENLRRLRAFGRQHAQPRKREREPWAS